MRVRKRLKQGGELFARAGSFRFGVVFNGVGAEDGLSGSKEAGVRTGKVFYSGWD